MQVFSRIILSIGFFFYGFVFPVESETDHTVYLPLVMRSEPGCIWPIPEQPTSSLQVELDTLAAINYERTSRGLAPVTLDSGLTRIARYHSYDMAENDFIRHDGSAGDTFSDRISWICNESFSSAGEIIGWNSNGDIDYMMEGWMNSEGHKAIILDPNYTVAGVGYISPSSGEHYWTVDFGNPQ